ncbi:RNA polymerase sigma factor [Evansella halocellulosilytica]|uniref:RNA polymerase sigma factor n=1 Tax=Evansella halocellulosilytica TaxID=2011013 RepID=UPI000BB818AA|nr:RNA polymerase sigma factor [Evansella halocellulosilytica]
MTTLTETNSESLIEEMDDDALIEVARTGDRDAFGELVRRYRNKAMSWAQMIAKDPETAEDIVQEALIKAFLHMGTLIDVSRFTPWLKTIVRNQANMKMRRGGPFAKEQPFTHIEYAHQINVDIDVHDIDHILYHLSQRVHENMYLKYGNPEAMLIKKDVLDGIRNLLHCLSKKERQVFEAYFFQQITPAEIASLFGMTIGNIYTTLSRSRNKVKRERTRIYISGYFKNYFGKESQKKNILAKPMRI